MLGAQVVKNSEQSGDDSPRTCVLPNEDSRPCLPRRRTWSDRCLRINQRDSESLDVHSTLTTVFGALDFRLTPRVDLDAELRQGLGNSA